MKRNKPKVFAAPVNGGKDRFIRPLSPIGRYQLKTAAAYLAIIAVILTLLNTYPLFVTQNIVFGYKHSAMSASASLIASALSGLDSLSPEGVGKILGDMDELKSYRVVVCNEDALAVYDSSLRDSAEGRTLVFDEIVEALAGSDVFVSVFASSAFESRLCSPIMNKGRLIGALYLYDIDSEQAALLKDLQSNLSMLSVIITAAIVIVSVVISMLMSHRISGLLRAIRALRDGDLGRKAPVRGKDELSEVALRFNELSEKLSRTEALRRQFVSDASHELKTPLASVKLLTDSILLSDNMAPDTLREFLTDIRDEIDRLTRLAEKLLELTRTGAPGESAAPASVNPSDVVRRAAHMLAPLAEKAGVRLLPELSEDCAVAADADDLYTVVYNLMENGVKYNKRGGTVKVFCFGDGKAVTLIVDDDGIGVPPEELPRIFERFYRVDKTRSREAGGTGLGLAIVELALVRLHGAVNVESEPGKGTRFTVTLPALGREENT
ncbi:MAG: HAMP domain-containing histidine kinase [Oscillospiraceae bacterium]|jgi:signal transduction histidine kinase|nr:HAMP domain-containing histidine kinase [Oscillospiraceae bacterium]